MPWYELVRVTDARHGVEVLVDEGVANELDDEIDRLAEDFAAPGSGCPDVQGAVRSDRETILLFGAPDEVAVHAWLTEWARPRASRLAEATL